MSPGLLAANEKALVTKLRGCQVYRDHAKPSLSLSLRGYVSAHIAAKSRCHPGTSLASAQKALLESALFMSTTEKLSSSFSSSGSIRVSPSTW